MVYILSNFENWKKQVQGDDMSNVKSVKVSQRMLDLLWKWNTNLSYKCRVSRGHSKPWNESSGPWKPWILYDTFPRTLKTLKMPFSDFHGDPEICLSVNGIELIIKYRKIVMQKLYLIRKQKYGL